MSGLAFDLNIPSVSVTAATVQCLAFCKPPANQRVKLLGYGIFLDGALNSAIPVEVTLSRTTDGTLTTGGTAVKSDAGLAETVQTVVGIAASVQPAPTAPQKFKTFTVHPQLGYEFLAPLGQEEMLAGGTSFAMTINAPATVNARGYVKFEE
jgi:hypothetical protein